MSLKLKVSVILLAVFAGLFAANAMVLRVLLWPSFEALERREAEEDVMRVHAAVKAEADALHNTVLDWAASDEANRFAVDRNAAFARHLARGGDAHRLDLHYVIDASGRRIAGSAHLPSGREPVELALLPPQLPRDHLLWTLMRAREGASGFINTEGGPLLIAAHPILGANPSGQPRGLVIAGRFVTEAWVAELGKRVEVELQLLPTTVGPSPAPGHPVLRFVEGAVEATTVVPSLVGPPAMSLRTTIPREITASGASAINYTLAALIVTAGVVMFVVLAVVQYLTLNPLARLAAHVRRLAETGNLAEQMHEERDDEFGYLSREFNRMQWRVSRLAFYDTLTDLPNRYMFTEHVRRALSRAERNGRSMAVFYLDLDGFKQVNDTLSHAVGDALLRQAAQRFRANLRSCDIVARLGGDEFTVLVEDLPDEGHIVPIAEKILGLFRKPFAIGDHTVSITTSLGVSLYPRSGATVDELLLAADIAMYRAKRGGPGRYHLYSEEDHPDLAPPASVTG